MLVCPTSPTTAFALGERTEDPLAMYLADVGTIPCNLGGLPGISVPVGLDENGLPIGFQLLAAPAGRGGAAARRPGRRGARRVHGAPGPGHLGGRR